MASYPVEASDADASLIQSQTVHIYSVTEESMATVLGEVLLWTRSGGVCGVLSSCSSSSTTSSSSLLSPPKRASTTARRVRVRSGDVRGSGVQSPSALGSFQRSWPPSQTRGPARRHIWGLYGGIRLRVPCRGPSFHPLTAVVEDRPRGMFPPCPNGPR